MCDSYKTIIFYIFNHFRRPRATVKWLDYNYKLTGEGSLIRVRIWILFLPNLFKKFQDQVLRQHQCQLQRLRQQERETIGTVDRVQDFLRCLKNTQAPHRECTPPEIKSERRSEEKEARSEGNEDGRKDKHEKEKKDSSDRNK